EHAEDAHGQRHPRAQVALVGERAGGQDRELLGNGHAESPEEEDDEDTEVGELLDEIIDHGMYTLPVWCGRRFAVNPRPRSQAASRFSSESRDRVHSSEGHIGARPMAVKLFVGGLSFSTSTDRLREAFAAFGNLASATA